MRHQQYSEEFKKSAVQKFLSRGSKSVGLFVSEMGISKPSLYEWVKEYAKAPGMKTEQRRPQDRTPQEKYDAVMAFDRLPTEGTERGAFLRNQGFYSEHIEQWRNQMQSGLEPGKLNASSRSELAEMSRELKELKKELQRKNNALAETTALLVLKKKADLIWGTGESE